MSLENCFKRTSKLRARNHLRRALVGAAIVPMLAALAPRAATAATKYWDINGATAGAGGATPTGTWDTTTANWSTDSAGAVAATTWAANDAAVFSAGTNGTRRRL
jgi:hypothetical protein